MQHYLLLILSFFLLAAQDMRIMPKKTWFSRSYEVYADHRYIGSVRHEPLRLNTIYRISDKYGECARGVAKFFSLGTLSKGLKKIKIFDETDMKLGYICGHFLQTRPVQYTFTDQGKHPIAVAYLDETGSHVKVVHPHHRHIVYALFEKRASKKKDYWEVSLIDEEAVDPRFFYIFAAFIADAYWSNDSVGKDAANHPARASQTLLPSPSRVCDPHPSYA